MAEIDDARRRSMSKIHNIPSECQFDHWKHVIAVKKFADAVLIATPDREHQDPAVAFAQKG